MHKHIMYIIVICLLATSCKEVEKNPCPEPYTHYGTIDLHFTHTYGDSLFQLRTNYLLDSGDTLQLSEINYVISDVSLVDTANNRLDIPNRYFIQQVGNERIITLDSIPVGSYYLLTFRMGFNNNDLSNTSLLSKHHILEEANTMLSDDQSSNLHLRIDGTFSGNEGAIGTIKIRNSTHSYSSLYEFGTLGSHVTRLAHNVPHTKVDLVVKENEASEIHFEAKIDWLFNLITSPDFDDSRYVNNLNTILYTNYKNGFFTHKIN